MLPLYPYRDQVIRKEREKKGKKETPHPNRTMRGYQPIGKERKRKKASENHLEICRRHHRFALFLSYVSFDSYPFPHSLTLSTRHRPTTSSHLKLACPNLGLLGGLSTLPDPSVVSACPKLMLCW